MEIYKYRLKLQCLRHLNSNQPKRQSAGPKRQSAWGLVVFWFLYVLGADSRYKRLASAILRIEINK